MDDASHDTIFEDEEAPSQDIAEVNFDLLEPEGKWLLKVVSGPNSGAEFFLNPNGNYLIGTDESSDIVFNDLSVSRQHARLIVDEKENVFIEDLGSKNGSFIEGEKISGRKNILSNTLITMGTTTFMLIDRQGEHTTIVSPQIFSLKKEEEKKENNPPPPIQGAVLAPMQSEVDKIKEEEKKEARYTSAVSAFIVLTLITGFIIVAGIGTRLLFKTEPINQERTEDIETLLSAALKDFPTIQYSYNPIEGKLLLVGHLSTLVDKNRMDDKLSQLGFLTKIDSSSVVIDNLVVSEFNVLLSKFPVWKSVCITAVSPGKFQLTGNLKTKAELDALSRYVSQNFPYFDRLENRVVAEEELKNEVAKTLLDGGFRNIALGISDGELVLTGTIANGKMPKFTQTLETLKNIPGVRTLTSYVVEAASDQPYINISNHYTVSGSSAHGTSTSVVIGGKILSKGDVLDGMTIIDIQRNSIILDKDGFKYKIDFNR